MSPAKARLQRAFQSPRSAVLIPKSTRAVDQLARPRRERVRRELGEEPGRQLVDLGVVVLLDVGAQANRERLGGEAPVRVGEVVPVQQLDGRVDVVGAEGGACRVERQDLGTGRSEAGRPPHGPYKIGSRGRDGDRGTLACGDEARREARRGRGGGDIGDGRDVAGHL